MLNVAEPTEAEVDPAAWVARIAAGERAAEAELVRHYSRVVLYLLRRRVRDPELARDLHQETFLALLKRLRQGELKEPRALPAFVRQIALNAATQVDRMNTRRKTDVDHDEIERFADPSQSSLDTLLCDERQRQLRASIAALPVPRDRELLLRFYVADEAKPSICTALGLSTDHFDRVLHRARQRLRKLLPAALRPQSESGS